MQEIFENEDKKQNQKKYAMHKYWGKKPAPELAAIINAFSNQGDLLLDPFSGYGGFASEAVLHNRNVIANDLNPVANFITKNLLSTDIDFGRINYYKRLIDEGMSDEADFWYRYDHNGISGYIMSILRDGKTDAPKMVKVKQDVTNKIIEVVLTQKQIIDFISKENNYVIQEWYPTNKLLVNSRISAKPGMDVSTLFPKSALAMHAKLFSLIQTIDNEKDRNLFEFTFTSNIANASKLVPPITSRGPMAPGAWMTGFYIGKTYIENNVLHYFNNRFAKILSGKKEFLETLKDSPMNKASYSVTNMDAKNLDAIDTEAIDFIFTDFPYGDTVPYFEQSIIWNSWLKYKPNYYDEIVISDSKERQHDYKKFATDIEKSVSEIDRVLKNNHYFVFTFHSVSGLEWLSLTNALISSHLKPLDFYWLTQKTFTPRQLNRQKTIKGDLMVLMVKDTNQKEGSYIKINEYETTQWIADCLLKIIYEFGSLTTNDLIINLIRKIFDQNMLLSNFNLMNIIKKTLIYDESNDLWKE